MESVVLCTSEKTTRGETPWMTLPVACLIPINLTKIAKKRIFCIFSSEKWPSSLGIQKLRNPRGFLRTNVKILSTSRVSVDMTLQRQRR